jgi:hypothetical protein
MKFTPYSCYGTQSAGKVKRFFSSPQCTEWLWGAAVVLSTGVKGPVREANHSPPASAEIKNSGAIPPLPHMFS